MRNDTNAIPCLRQRLPHGQSYGFLARSVVWVKVYGDGIMRDFVDFAKKKIKCNKEKCKNCVAFRVIEEDPGLRPGLNIKKVCMA